MRQGMTSFRERSTNSRYRNYLFNPKYWLIAVKEPKKALQNLFAIVRYPKLYKVARSVEGLISHHFGVILYRTVLGSKHDSPNIVEVGAFKGLSTIYLSLAAIRAGKRIKSFELFSGLPTSNEVFDPTFSKNQFSSSVEEYRTNLGRYGCSDVVDLTTGDARDILMQVLGNEGYSVAFLDVDVYEVMRDLLELLWSVTQGGESILIHDVWSPGVRKALDEFHNLSNNTVIETTPEKGTSKLQIPINKRKV